MVEAKVINIGFNRVTLRSQKGNQASYAFNSDKFLKWFNKVPLTEHMRLHAENKKADILDGVKVVTSGPSVKERTSTPKEKESKFKLDFDFADENEGGFLILAEFYSNEKRNKRLGVLFFPMTYGGDGFQASLIIVHALSFMADLKHHSDAEWNAMIENRDIENCFFDTFDDMLVGDVTLFCKVIETYAKNLIRPDGKTRGVTLEEWANFLPRNKEEAKFVAQLLCDGGINKYDLTCAGLTPGVLADNLWSYGFRDEDYDDEGNVIRERDIVTGEELKEESNVE
ncbi:HP0423 family protein [Helicobacter pylori]|nr:HP0423 family protein [Helicobacter pylori]